MRFVAVPATLAVAALLGAAPAHAATDEDEVRAVLDVMNGAYNRSDFAGFQSHLCPKMQESLGYETTWRRSRAADGTTNITVNSIAVSGNNAVAVVRFDAANRPTARTVEIGFDRVGTEWKACRYDTTLSV